MEKTLQQKENEIKEAFSMFKNLVKDPNSILESKPFGVNSWLYKVYLKEVQEYNIELRVLGFDGTIEIESVKIKQFRLINGLKPVIYVLSENTAMKFINEFLDNYNKILLEKNRSMDYTDVEI